MVRKALTKAAKEAVKKGAEKKRGRGRPKGSTNKPKTQSTPKPLTRTPAAQRRTAQRKARANRSAKPKSAPTPLTRTPAAQRRRSQRAARAATGATAVTAASESSRAKNIAKNVAKFAVPAIGVTALATSLGKKPKASEASGVTFGEAFKQARAKGEGTKFSYKGKQYSAVTKDDLKRKGYDANELKQYLNRKGKARRPIQRLGQGIKKVLLGKDKKFGGDKGAIDFIRRRKKKTPSVQSQAKRMGPGPGKKKDGGMANARPKKFKAGGLAKRGLGKAYMNSKR